MGLLAFSEAEGAAPPPIFSPSPRRAGENPVGEWAGCAVELFVSSFTNKIDAKGRVSVPASFRAVLTKDGFEGIYCYPSLDQPALDAGGQRLVSKINGLLEDLAPYSDERDHLATALFGVSEILSIDGDGRTMLPERLRAHAGIDKEVTFVGLGEKFQIWEPKRFEAQMSEARQKVRDLRKVLGAGSRSGGGLAGAMPEGGAKGAAQEPRE